MGIKYDSNKRELSLIKMDTHYDLDPLQNIKDSYRKYLNQTIQEDFRYFEEKLKETVGTRGGDALQVTFRKKDNTYRYREQNKNTNFGIEFEAMTSYKGIIRPYELIFTVPGLETDGTLNFKGKLKTLVWSLVSDDVISKDHKDQKNSIMLVTKRGKVEVTSLSNKLIFKFNKRTKADFFTVIQGLSTLEGRYIDFDKEFSNHIIKLELVKEEYRSADLSKDSIEKFNITKLLKSDNYSIKKTREYLKRLINFDVAIGRTLSRDVVDEEGNVIKRAGAKLSKLDTTMLNKMEAIEGIHITHAPVIKNYRIYEDIVIQEIPKGTKITDEVKSIINTSQQVGDYLEVDTPVLPNCQNLRGSQISKELIELMLKCGITSTYCITPQRHIFEVPFEQEIRVFRGEGDEITSSDFMTLISLYCRDLVGDFQNIPNRDLNFLKKIIGINETFSKCFRDATDEFLKINKRNIVTKVTAGEADNIFYGFQKVWESKLNSSKLLRSVEDTNPASLISQVNRVVTVLGNKKAKPSPILKSLVLPQYSRICPYETPSGKQIGLVTNLANGCKIQDTIPYAPYYKVTSSSKGLKVDTSKVVYLSVVDEYSKNIGDISQLQFDEEGNVLNTLVMARVPAHPLSPEKLTIQTIEAQSLDYVTTFPEQHCSNVSALIPFAAANDAVRDSYALSLIKQAISLSNSNPPLVITPYWRKIVEASEKFAIKAKKDTYVVDVSTDTVVLDDLTMEEVIALEEYVDESTMKNFNEVSLNSDGVVFRNIRKGPNESVRKGEIIMDSSVSKDGILSLGNNVLAVHLPTDGYNYEDAINISVDGAKKFTSLTNNKDKISIMKGSKGSPKRSMTNQYFQVGDTIYTKKDMEGNPTSELKCKNSGVLFDIKTDKSSFTGETNYTFSFVDYKDLEKGDKMSGLHGDKGVVSRVLENSKMPQFKNGVIADIAVNPCGSVSRMNLGKQLEGHVGFVAYMLDIRIVVGAFNTEGLSVVEDLVEFVWDCANIEWDQVLSKYNGTPYEQLLEPAMENIENIRKWKDAFYPNGTADFFNPETGTFFENPLVFGMPYFLKESQEVEHKLHARGGILHSTYSAITRQPLKGSQKGGGQAMGEMELAVLAAHGASNLLRECMNEKSDDVYGKMNHLIDILNREWEFQKYDKSYCYPRAVDLLRNYLEPMGLSMEIQHPEFPKNKDEEDWRNSNLYKVKDVILGNNPTSKVITEEQSFESLLNDWKFDV